MSFSVGSGRVLSYVLVVAVICGVSTGRIHPEFATSSVDPQGQAQRLIKALNLFPDVLSVSDGEEVFDGAKLQERRLNLDVGGDAGVSTEELGQYAGYFKLARTHAAKMFYFFFESRGNKTDDPVVLWMTGGPGCASELALFYENGPFKITDNLILVWNDFGWDKVSSIIFVDQPVGTGFSYSTDIRDIRHDEEGVSEDMYDFFQAFYEAHPEFVKNKLFVTGESYAGHYVPAVAGRLHRALKHKEGVPIDLKGFAIGNGLTQPDIQYEAYGDYALEMNLITEEEHQKLGKLYLACAAALKFCGPKGTIGCVAASFVCQSIFTSILGIAGNINNLEKGIPGLLEDGIELLVYAGEYDLICNWLGNSRWVTAMDWSGQVEYAKAGWKSFEVDGEEAGLTTGYGPLQFLKVHNAGHMVPMDQPKNSLEMLYRWTRGISLGGNSFDATIVKEIRRNGNKYTKSA
ncbi:serine carboxypeptidase-like isoform X2 [Physcomitrium patens]|uniref:Carboxypeptidase n=1 Tax=Physcomitrium patens TaxID=3218 RepID=A0A7I4CT77_PHYPA